MAVLEDSFERLVGRQPSDAEKQQLFRVRDALGLRPNDALWQVLIALEYYQRQYEKFPVEISKACQSVLAEFTASATAQANAAHAEATKALSEAVAKAASSSARNATRKQLIQWCVGCLVLVGALLATSAFLGYRAGRGADSMSAWASSGEGRLAYELARVGSIRVLARCEGPGWEVRGSKCYPQPLDGKTVFGWQIPSGDERELSHKGLK